MTDRGRIDWMPRLKMWRVVAYRGYKDVDAGHYEDKGTAERKLRELVERKG